MSPQEIQLPLTPQQAAEGTIVTVPLPNGTARLRIPPSRDGDLVRARFGDNEVLLRVRVTPTGAAPAPAAPPKKSGPLGCLLALGVVAAVIIAIVVTNDGKDDDAKNTASHTPTYAAPTTRDPYPTPTYTYAPSTTRPTLPTLPALPLPTTEAAPTPFDKGTCLNGRLPDSETAQRVDDVKEVSCSASDAHYKVIQRFPFSSDMEQCKSNPDTEYAFSYRYTINGSVINQYVYCLIGLGSYSRS
ncbi:LppU/SCO3897 family protein [Streptomyces lavendulae]|uniref:LppU/SCO3897 family protein n=1 Tax=Streptomyces lavendulae TaxID=1914 RepID=UPI00367F522E